MSKYNTDIFIKRLQSLLNKDNRAKGIFHKNVVKAGQITNWKKRGSAPQADKLFAIAQYFNVSIDYLVGLSDIPTLKKTKTVYALPPKPVMLDFESPAARRNGHSSQDKQEMIQQIGRICNKRSTRDIDKMRLFLTALDPGDDEIE